MYCCLQACFAPNAAIGAMIAMEGEVVTSLTMSSLDSLCVLCAVNLVSDGSKMIDIAASFVLTDMVKLQSFGNWTILSFPKVFVYGGALAAISNTAVAIALLGTAKYMARTACNGAWKLVASNSWGTSTFDDCRVQRKELAAPLLLLAVAAAKFSFARLWVCASRECAQLYRRLIRHEPSSFQGGFVSEPNALTFGSRYYI